MTEAARLTEEELSPLARRELCKQALAQAATIQALTAENAESYRTLTATIDDLLTRAESAEAQVWRLRRFIEGVAEGLDDAGIHASAATVRKALSDTGVK